MQAARALRKIRLSPLAVPANTGEMFPIPSASYETEPMSAITCRGEQPQTPCTDELKFEFQSRIQPRRVWCKEQKAERDSGLSIQQAVPRVSLVECAICGLQIGPGYAQQEMYLYPVVNKRIQLSDDMYYKIEHDWLEICGGCAHDKKRGIPPKLLPILRIIHPALWQTTILLNRRFDPIQPEQEQQAFAAIRPYVLALYRWILFVNLLEHHIPPTWLFAKNESEVGQPIWVDPATKKRMELMQRMLAQPQDNPITSITSKIAAIAKSANLPMGTMASAIRSFPYTPSQQQPQKTSYAM